MFDSMVLFQDELHDNGDCIETVKFRVMQSGFFCLHRLFLRGMFVVVVLSSSSCFSSVDNVVSTIHDTRVYHEFGSDVVLHEFQVRSSTYQELEKEGKIPSDLSKLADDNYMYENCKQRELVTKVIKMNNK